MFVLLFIALLQVSIERAILETEDRREDASTILKALDKNHSDPAVQRLAVRALGRLERPRYADTVTPLLHSPDKAVRMEAINALGQMGTDLDLGVPLAEERDDEVRSVYYETIGRLPITDDELFLKLVKGLQEPGPHARVGAAKGLESYFRLTENKPRLETLTALREALRTTDSSTLRQLVLLTLNRAEDRDTATLTAALTDDDPLVRRLAVIGLEVPKEDPSPIVRYESLKVSKRCEQVESALQDPSEHVVLLAIEYLGNNCSAELLMKLTDEGKDWRRQARALVSLAKVNPEAARERLSTFRNHSTWQARTYAAAAAKILKDERNLEILRRDTHPNVVAAALVSPGDAVAALESPHYGLLMVALERLQDWSQGGSAVPALLESLERVSGQKRATSRDPRRQILERLREYGDEKIANKLRYLLSDFDPVIAALAAEIISEKSGRTVSPVTLRLKTKPLPSANVLEALDGARARIHMRDAGSFTLELIPEEAPITVATFVRLAEQGYYDGLTFHRIVPNFVIQGGSPGANEYVGTAGFIRDEVGLLSHERGTVGISTRGRDTGDSQLFINLVDNYRLDHSYTVFARVIDGMRAVDQIQEDDIIESIEIARK
jgi:cyclophilin family peptidyl-prolyl cis-trans isomerase/HEAT repeat protein